MAAPVPLFLARRFAPLFATQFLGAFNDNLFRFAMLFLITFHVVADTRAAGTLVSAAAGIFILPYVLFSGVAGTLSDAVDKARVARGVKLAEVAILGIGAVGLMTASVPLLFVVLFAMGVHSTVFGPMKYAIVPQHLAPGELLAGTGMIEGATFVAILLGQIAGGLLPTRVAAVAMLAAAVGGVVVSRRIPPAPPAPDAPPVDLNPWRSSRAALRGAFAVPAVGRATVAISWFWALGTVYTAQFVPLVRDLWFLGALRQTVATAFLVTFTVGIALGSTAVSRLLNGRVSARAAPAAAAAMAVASGVFAVAVGTTWLGGLFPYSGPIAIFGALFVMAAAGGVFSVPLYAILATRSAAATRSSAVAANNILNAAWQVGGTLAAGAAIAVGGSIPLVLGVAGASALLLVPMLRRL